MKSSCLWLCILLYVCFSAPASLQAQSEGAIHGTVVAAADRSALAGAAVRLQGAASSVDLATTVDAAGRFAFLRLPPGDYILTVSREAFLERNYRLSLKPREVQHLTPDLSLRPLEATVQVASTDAWLPATFSPSSTVLSSRRIEGLPLPQRSNLTDAIVTSAPGMIRGHDDFAHIRGSEIALNPFIDGVSFWENPHSLFSPNLGSDFIESINVMTGGFPAEYGNRFGGVLDIATKSGFSMQRNGTVVLGAGTALRHNASVEIGGHSGRMAYYLNAAAFSSARFQSPPDARSIHNTGRGARSFLRLDFAPDPGNFLKLVLMADGANFQIPKTSLDEELRPNLNSFQRTRSQSAILSWDRVQGTDGLFQAAVYQKWSHSRLLPNDDPYGARADSDRTLHTLGFKTDVTRFAGRHTFKGGIDLVMLRPQEELYYLSQPWIDYTHVIGVPHIHFRGPNMGPGAPRPVIFEARKTGGQASAYVQDQVRVTEALTANIGLRFDRYSLAISESHWSPRLNLAYRFPSNTVLHGSYNHFFVPPPIENVLLNSAGLTRSISEIGQPLPALRPIVEDQFEVGLTQAFGSFAEAGVTGYYRTSRDPVHTVLFPDVRVYAYANFEKGKAYGFEAKLNLQEVASTGLSGYMNYALGRVWFYNPITAGFTTEAGHLDESSRFPAPMDQTHTLTSGLTYNSGIGVWASLALEYGSGTPEGHGLSHDHGADDSDPHSHSPGEEHSSGRVPGHWTQNVTLGWDVVPMTSEGPGLTLQFNIENLSNNVYVVARESPFTPGQYSTPRMFSGSAKIRF